MTCTTCIQRTAVVLQFGDVAAKAREATAGVLQYCVQFTVQRFLVCDDALECLATQTGLPAIRP